MIRVDRAQLVAFVAAAGIVCQCSASYAQSAEAEVLFRDGRTLIKRGKLADGCDKLAASERLESSIGTLLNLGDCREKLGKVASAWAAFRKAESMARRSGGDDRRQAEAARRAALLEPRLPNLVIEVSWRVDGLVVRRDREIVDAAQWSTAMPVDPGSYTVAVEAPGYLPWRTTVAVAAGAKRQVVVVPSLDRAPAPEPVAPPEASGSRSGPQVTGTESARPVLMVRPAETWSTTRKVSVAFAVAGAGALGTGLYFGWRASDLQDQADRRCPLVVCGNSEALRLNDEARTAAMRANVLYIAGGATLATALVLWFVGAPGETIVRPTGGDHHIGVSMTGSF